MSLGLGGHVMGRWLVAAADQLQEVVDTVETGGRNCTSQNTHSTGNLCIVYSQSL